MHCREKSLPSLPPAGWARRGWVSPLSPAEARCAVVRKNGLRGDCLLMTGHAPAMCPDRSLEAPWDRS
jgi:hypothetical protein